MTDEEFVRLKYPSARVVRMARRGSPWRVKIGHSPRHYLGYGAKSEARAWQAARQKLLTVRTGDLIPTPFGYAWLVLDPGATTGLCHVEQRFTNGVPWRARSLPLRYLLLDKHRAEGWT